MHGVQVLEQPDERQLVPDLIDSNFFQKRVSTFRRIQHGRQAGAVNASLFEQTCILGHVWLLPHKLHHVECSHFVHRLVQRR
eukprot:SAG31_NODE_77_length_27533_cov_47.448859_25_plen_81_part_01